MKDADIQRLWDEAQKERQAFQRGVVGDVPDSLGDAIRQGVDVGQFAKPAQVAKSAWDNAAKEWHSRYLIPNREMKRLTEEFGPCPWLSPCDGQPLQSATHPHEPVDFATHSERIAKTEYFDWQQTIYDAWPHWEATVGWPIRQQTGCPMAQAEMSDSQTIVPAADDVGFIAKRLKELDAERAEEAKNSDPELATEKHLDQIGENWGVMRNPCESDYTYRQRLLRAGGWIV